MKKLLLLVVLLLVVLLALTVLLYSLFGWLGFLVLLVLLALGAYYAKSMVGKSLQKAFIAPFAAKGAVLKDATVEIHSVEPASRPARTFEAATGEESIINEDEGEDEDAFAEEYNRYFSIDATIAPQSTEGPFQMWEPGELILVKPDTRSGVFDDDDDSEISSVLDVQIWNEGTWMEDEGMKYHGPQRVKLLVGVQDNVASCRFRYYFEVFGKVDLRDADVIAD